MNPPRTVRPDTVEAIDWLVGAEPNLVVVDGYNVGFLLSPEIERARALAIEAARRLALACPTCRPIVVFDGREGLEARSEPRSGDVEVVFSSGETADDEIVRRVAGAARSVVVTNDRELRQRAEGEGAVALWSDALVEWSRRR